MSAHTLILQSTACFTPSGSPMKQASKNTKMWKWCIHKKDNTRVHKVARPKKALESPSISNAQGAMQSSTHSWAPSN